MDSRSGAHNFNPKETVLSLLNQLTFGNGYSFKGTLVDHRTGETYNYEGNVENINDGKQFFSSVKMLTPIQFEGGAITEVSTLYKDHNPQNSDGFGISYNSALSGLEVGPDLKNSSGEQMMEQLLGLHFTGDDRKK